MTPLLTEPFVLTAAAVGLLSGVLCAYVGNFVLMQNMTFISIALAEIAALGVAVGIALGLNPNVAAFTATLVAVWYFWRRKRRHRPLTEGSIGVWYAASAALAVIVVSQNPLMESHGVDLVSGNLLYATRGDLNLLALTCLGMATVHIAFRRKFLLVSFDRETASAQGVRAPWWDLLLMLTLAVCIAVCMKVTGVLFVFAALVIPGMAGLALFRRVGLVFLAAIGVASGSVIAGLLISLRFDVPTSPAIICAMAALYLVAGCRRRG